MSEQKVVDGVIHFEDGHRETAHKKLRLITLPKVNFLAPSEKMVIDDQIEEQIKEVFEKYCDGDHAKSADIVAGLKSINFHIDQPYIMRIIEDFHIISQKDGKDEVTFPKFMNYLNSRLSDYTQWNSCGNLFDNIKDNKLEEKTGLREITAESLLEAIKDSGVDNLSLDDIKYIMDYVSDGKDPNITQDEFY